MKEDQICQVFSGLVHLEALYLHYNGAKVTDQILRTIATRCKRLTELDLGQCTQITDFSTLNGLTNLKSLNLSHTKVIYHFLDDRVLHSIFYLFFLQKKN